MFLARIELEVNCNEGKFKYQSGSLAIDNFFDALEKPLSAP